ncbi:MAG TPA: glycogen debranching enzyme N-terminal domain-containing protein [Candidatus Omnitrophota bacterium]|nr:glycogen debranching enzyme N-terminal domain-containing protein [Candidatus Omnitrophota bacterium]
MIEPITFPKDICQDLALACRKEWIETNGLGGYAASTLALANTSRHHGLLVSAVEPPFKPYVLLSSLEDALEIEGHKFYLSNHFYPGSVFPKGYENLIEFRQDPFPTFVYEIGDAWLEKTVFLVHGEDTVVILYRLLSSDVPVKLIVRPLTAFRAADTLTGENPKLNASLRTSKGEVVFQPYQSLPALFFNHNAVILDKESYWYKNFEYAAEEIEEKGFREDLFSPFSLLYSFSSTNEVFLVASTHSKQEASLDEIFQREMERREKIDASFPTKDQPWGFLWQTAESFLVNDRLGKRALKAGYLSSRENPRNTLLSLHGISLVRGRPEEARDILIARSREFEEAGFIPLKNEPEEGVSRIRKIETPLWYAEAVEDYFRCSDAAETVEKEFYPLLKKIIQTYRRGIPGLFGTGQDGLLEILNPGRRESGPGAPDRPLQSRIKPVALNALWYNALSILRELTVRFGEPQMGMEYAALAKTVRESFNRDFWLEGKGHLCHGVTEQGKDETLRPCSIFAMSLSFPVLDESRWKSQIVAVEKELLTPFGLRTLPPGAPGYVPSCEGNEGRRACACGQGAVHPWLLGAFFTGVIRTFGDSREVRIKMREAIDPLLEHVYDAGLGSLSEMFDGNPPHISRGCASYALNVAELLRVYELLKGLRISATSPKEFILR